jgi:hypothetical protein
MTDRDTPVPQCSGAQHRRHRVRDAPLQTTLITRQAILTFALVLAIVALGAAMIGVVVVMLGVIR